MKQPKIEETAPEKSFPIGIIESPLGTQLSITKSAISYSFF
jgi:hypothetical protein